MTRVVEQRRLLLPRLHAGAQRMLAEAKRENWACMGRRWRKTSSVSTHVVIKRLATHKGEQWLWGAPTYDQVQVARAEAERAANGTFKIYKADRIMECPWTESLVRFRSLDNPDNARGHTADGIAIDEAADINPDAFHKVLRPMLLDTQGIFWATFTPKGHNWVWRQVQHALERLRRDPDADLAVFQAPTLGARIENGKLIRAPHPYENSEISFDQLKEWFEDGTTPESVFRQEYLAEFLADGAGVFIGVEACVGPIALAPPFFGPFKRPYQGTFAIGVDWGRYNDFTVVTVIDCETKEIVDWWRVNNRSFEALADGVAEIYERWKLGGINTVACLVEFNSIGMPQLEQLWKRNVPATPWTATNATKAQVVESLQFGIEHKQVSFPRIVPLVNELQAFETQRLPSGLIRYAAPGGEHDDTVISLALAYEGTQYREPGEEEKRFELDLDAEDQVVKPGRELLDEYKASLLLERAKQMGIEHLPLGGQRLLQKYQERES